MKRTILLLAGFLPGCRGDDCCTQTHFDAAIADGGVQPDPNLTEVALVPSTVNRDLDVLFVIDDSSSMIDKQPRLRESFPRLLQVLAVGVLPNLHIGVITTDMGTKGTLDVSPGANLASCSGFGKDGELQTSGAPVTDRYLSNVAAADGTRVTNYTGALLDAFTTMATPGTSGCLVGQPLQAIKRSLENPANAGFLRDGARLAIVLLTDADDCSLAHSSLLSDASLGSGILFRCAKYGVTCDVGGTTPDEMAVPGDKVGCHGNPNPDFVADVETYASFVSHTKADPRDVLFEAIVAPPGPFTVETYTNIADNTLADTVAPSCGFSGFQASIAPSTAQPPTRIAQLAGALRRGRLEDICDAYFPGVMTRLGERLKNLVGGSCVEQRIATPARCEVFDAVGTALTPIPPCSSPDAKDCYTLTKNATACPVGQQLELQVVRSHPAAAGTWTTLHCAT